MMEGTLTMRIYSLAKELNCDSKKLVDVCKQAGITGKDSALASLSEDEIQQVKRFLNKGFETGVPAEGVEAPTNPTQLSYEPSKVVSTSRSLAGHGQKATEGTVYLTYRPLENLDALQLGILQTLENQPIVPLARTKTRRHQRRVRQLVAKIFSLPVGVVVKELAILESYGLISSNPALLSIRGRRCVAFSKSFEGSHRIQIFSDNTQWRLGKGEFVVDDHFRDGNDISKRAAMDGIHRERDLTEFVIKFESTKQQIQKFESKFTGDMKLMKLPNDPAELEQTLRTTTETVIQHMQKTASYKIVGSLTNSLKSFHAAVTSLSDSSKESYQPLEYEKIQTAINSAQKLLERNSGVCFRNSISLREKKMVCDAVLIRNWMDCCDLKSVFDSEPAAFHFFSDIDLPTVPLKVRRSTPVDQGTTCGAVATVFIFITIGCLYMLLR
jgi:hypothetical protein